MKSNGVFCMLTGLLALTPAAFGQRWEVGGGAGGGFYTSQTISNSTAGNADAKIAAGPVAGVWLGYNQTERWGGEVRYGLQTGDMQLNSGSTQASFSSATHTMTYDFHYHFRTTEDRVRPFVAFGAGIKLYQGTGNEIAAQPLYKVALLTKTNDLRAVASFGFGIKARINEHWQFRAEVHDYLSPFPNNIFAPNNGSKTPGWFNDITPMAGISYIF
jgi:outer membrane protein W